MTLRPPCDVIDDVITMKNTFWYNLGRSFISEVKMKQCFIFQSFQIGRYFEVATNFCY